METSYPPSFVSNSSLLMQQKRSPIWTREENKRFERAIVIYDEKTPNRWHMVASMLPGKSVSDVINQYRELVKDICNIEAGLVPTPGYLATSLTFGVGEYRGFDAYAYRKRGKNRDQERRRGVPWTEEEHRRFLLGLERHGKGDWRNISRNFVISKTPTQVASHAQKYFLRQLGGGKDKRRPSIHDITTLNLTDTTITTAAAAATATTTCCSIPIDKKPLNSNASPNTVFDWTYKGNGALTVLDSIGYPQDFVKFHGRAASNICSGY